MGESCCELVRGQGLGDLDFGRATEQEEGEEKDLPSHD